MGSSFSTNKESSIIRYHQLVTPDESFNQELKNSRKKDFAKCEELLRNKIQELISDDDFILSVVNHKRFVYEKDLFDKKTVEMCHHRWEKSRVIDVFKIRHSRFHRDFEFRFY